MTVALELPFDLFEATRLKPEEIKRELALTLYRQGKLSFGKARELAGMDIWAFMHLLGLEGVPMHYALADYQEDLRTLREMKRL